MFVRWHKLALAELDEIISQAHERNPQEALNMRSAVERTLNTLQMFPKAGRYVRAGDWHEKYVPHTRLIFIYRFTDDELAIIATFHTSREPKTKPLERRFDEL